MAQPALPTPTQAAHSTTAPTATSPMSRWNALIKEGIAAQMVQSTIAPTATSPLSRWRAVPKKRTTVPASPPQQQSSSQRLSTAGWLHAGKTMIVHRKEFPCDLCGLVLDNIKNLHQHRDMRRCRERRRPISPMSIPSPSVDESSPIPYRRRRQLIISDDESSSDDGEITVLNSPTVSAAQEPDALRISDDESSSDDEGEDTVVNSPRVSVAQEPEAEVYVCRNCDAQFNSINALLTHTQDCITESSSEEEPMAQLPEPPAVQANFTCGQCAAGFGTLVELKMHRRHCHPDNMVNITEVCRSFECDTCSMEPAECAFGGRYRSVNVKPAIRCATIEQMLLETGSGIERILQHCLDYGDQGKVFCTAQIIMHKINFLDGE